MTEKDTLLWQLDATWRLAWVFLSDLTDAECLWQPAAGAWTVRPNGVGAWHADFQEPEPDPAPPTSIAWVTWHIGWWWSDIHARALGGDGVSHANATWPGTAEGTRVQLARCHGQWAEMVEGLAAAEFESEALAAGCGPLVGRPFGRIVAWVNMELMKNTAEIGAGRRLYANRATME